MTILSTQAAEEVKTMEDVLKKISALAVSRMQDIHDNILLGLATIVHHQSKELALFHDLERDIISGEIKQEKILYVMEELKKLRDELIQETLAKQAPTGVIEGAMK